MHGGPALKNVSVNAASDNTLNPAEIKAVVTFMRTVADPPYQTPGVKYGKERLNRLARLYWRTGKNSFIRRSCPEKGEES
jgi:hypothetical protein